MAILDPWLQRESDRWRKGDGPQLSGSGYLNDTNFRMQRSQRLSYTIDMLAPARYQKDVEEKSPRLTGLKSINGKSVTFEYHNHASTNEIVYL